MGNLRLPPMLQEVITFGVLPGLIVGALFGLVPWLALRRQFERSARLIWASVGGWIPAFALPLIILRGQGVGDPIYGGAGIGVVNPGGARYAFGLVAVGLAPPIGALLAGVFLWIILRRQVPRPGRIAVIAALGWPFSLYGVLAFALLLGRVLPNEIPRLLFTALLLIGAAAAIALVLIISRRLIGRLVRTAPGSNPSSAS